MNDKHTGFIVRAAGFEDTAEIFDLIKSYPEELLARPMSDIVENIDRFRVCIVDGKVAGTVSWQILPEIGAPKDPSIEIKSLAVQKNLRSTGIGRALITAAINHIKTLHPAQIIALTFHPEFFIKLGFTKIQKESLIHKIYMGCKNCSKYDSPFTCPEIAVALSVRQQTQQ